MKATATSVATPGLTDLFRDSLPAREVDRTSREYTSLFDEERGGTAAKRKSQYTTLVNDYYDLVTDFYEFGWGQSFHFAPRHKGEAFHASLARHEFQLALRLGLRPGMKVLDIGCGVGGPMRAIARFSGAGIVGVNNNDYQIERGRKQTLEAGLSDRCEFLKADFMNLSVPPESFDGAYAIEATCHAPDKHGVFSQVYRALKPGSVFVGYEWCVTATYDAASAEHRAIKKGIEEGDALPELATFAEVQAGLTRAGFQLLEARDLVPTSDPETPWYLPLDGQLTLSGWKHTRAGRWLTNRAVRLLETARIAPRGSTSVSTFLNAGADALVKGGKLGIFTPMYFFAARKPAEHQPRRETFQ